MNTLSAILLSPDQLNGLTHDLIALLRRHVAQRGGLKGTAYRTGLAMLERARPGIVDRAAQKLLPKVLARLEPYYARYRSGGGAGFAQQLMAEAEAVTTDLMRLADEQAAAASDGVQKIYARFRSGAQDEVSSLLPALASLLDARLPR
jgi:hypothetical protein